MREDRKNQLLEEAKKHIHQVQESVDKAIVENKDFLGGIQNKINSPSSSGAVGEAAMLFRLYSSAKERYIQSEEELHLLKDSPYFVKCIVKFPSKTSPETFYFSKFNFLPESIYSWVVPAATMRFEDPGEISYKVPTGEIIKGELLSKDQFMIVNGKILFMTTEAQREERQMVYQEYLSTRKSGFVLQEIVEQMEKSQDAVIRAHYKGSFLISGPAGSGKTTLALHRVAYLAQSPETASLFPSKDIIVFVQDASTKAYFGALLPELGIKDVKITTYGDWAKEMLNLKDFEVISRFGDSEEEKDLFEYYKKKALQKVSEFKVKKDVIETLKTFYKDVLPKVLYKLFLEQIDQKLLDRFDLTALLTIKTHTTGKLTKERNSFSDRRVNGKYRQIVVQDPVEYSLIILDEVQNYLPEQISLFKKAISKRTEAMLYVGDLAQQTQLSTIRNWDEVGEEFGEGRKVTLDKVYRNTKQILQYIEKQGYKVSIPERLKEGEEVRELEVKSEELRVKIEELIKKHGEETMGVLSKNKEVLEHLKQTMSFNEKKVFFMTISEAQGVEFDVVCLIKNENDFQTKYLEKHSQELREEKERVNRDLMYVGMTRAINKLEVILVK